MTPAQTDLASRSGQVGMWLSLLGGFVLLLGGVPLFGGWGAGDAWWEEASSLGWGLGVDGEAVLVDDYVVVEPAQQGESVGVVGSAP